MDLTLSDLAARDRYKLLSALVVPRPIAWITTLNADGTTNAAPYSFFNLLGSRPPVVAVGPDDSEGVKDTARNVRRAAGDGNGQPADSDRQRGTFVVNVVSEEVAEAMHATSARYPEGTSETEALGIETVTPDGWPVPRIAAAPAALACREHTTLFIGETRVLLGVVEHLYVRDDLIDADRWRIDQQALQPVGRLGGGLYTRTRDHLDLGPRPNP